MKESRVLLMILDGWGKSKNPNTSVAQSLSSDLNQEVKFNF